MRSRYNEIQSMDAEVIIISFGTDVWVKEWLKQVQVPFPLLLDPERRAYRAYGLERSMVRAWGLKNGWHYLKAVLGGQRLYRLRGDDTAQMGGDFIVDSGGILRFTHPSHDPTDRPSAGELLQALKRRGI